MTSKPISLMPTFLRTHGNEEAEEAIRKIVCSVTFELVPTENAFRLLGPEMSYHNVDPHLPRVLDSFRKSGAFDDVLGYRSSQLDFDLYLEDSWTGYFIAKGMVGDTAPHEFVLIHLDDHTDMMSTLLCVSAEHLINPTSAAVFDPMSSSDWEAAIYSGAVNIGNYITPFFYSGSKVHVRHIRDATDHSELSWVTRESRNYELIPDRQFAAVTLSACESASAVGTYLAGSDPDTVLQCSPEAWTILHIDLDYFINDFNGASRGTMYIPDAELQATARKKMTRFFATLAKLKPPIHQWLIGTSPGFCSAYHWEFLLSELGERIRSFKNAQGS